MNTKMLTETEVLGMSLAAALKNKPSSFGATEAKTAIDTATKFFPNRVDAETFGRVITRLGNHSALRQWAIAHGFIVAPDDALTVAVREIIADMVTADVENLEELTKPNGVK